MSRINRADVNAVNVMKNLHNKNINTFCIRYYTKIA